MGKARNDKHQSRVERLRGKAKQVAGKVTGKEGQRAEGRAGQVKADLRQAVGKAKDAFRR